METVTTNTHFKKIIDDFFANNAIKLHRMADKVLYNLGFHNIDKEEFYSLSHEVFYKALMNYDESKSFNGFLYSCLYKKFCTEMTKSNRDKRINKVKVEKKNENGDVVIEKVKIPNISIDAPISENGETTLADLLYSDFNLEDEIFFDKPDENVEDILNSLSKIQREIIKMKMNDVRTSDIKEILGLSDNQYEDCMKSIRENRNVILFKNKEKRQNLKKIRKIGEGKTMKYKEEINIEDALEIDTTDSYRTDKNPLGCLLNDMVDELSPTYIDRNYISQRQPFVWKDEQINKFYSRVLNNQPIPEIIICEQVKNGEKVSFLIDGLQRLSYAEAFKNNVISIKAKGAEFVNIKYKERYIDENGKVHVKQEICNIIGKYYKDLPEFLQKRFDNFNITVTRFFNCSDEMIDYHLRNYNNHVAMNKSQYGITNISNETATNIKNISYKHPFFNDNVKATNANRKNGAWDEVVARSIVNMYYPNECKREVKDVFKFVDKNVTSGQFKHLEQNLDRLSAVVDTSVKELFTTTNTPTWLVVYDKFRDVCSDDTKFVEFMRYFKNLLDDDNEINEVKEIYKDRHTRDKKIVIGKINSITELMFEFLCLNEENAEGVEVNTSEFVKEMVDPEIEENDIIQYAEILDEIINDSILSVNSESRLLDEYNRPSLIAIVAYIFVNSKINIDLDKWFVDYFKNHSSYIINQKQNFIEMKNDISKCLSSQHYVTEVA